ncbi:MAG: hypothetical protein NVSMB1_13710 [Polyangiales bacterium]
MIYPSSAHIVAAITVVSSGLIASAQTGCGPGIRTIVEGDMRFEHCYRIDEDERTAVADKKTCWDDWTVNHTSGQDPSRVKYANDRLHAIDASTRAPALPSPGGSASTNIAAMIGAPLPASIYHAPPSIAAKVKKPFAEEPSTTAGIPANWLVCGDACAKSFHTCSPPCAGALPCMKACDAHFQACMRTCF